MNKFEIQVFQLTNQIRQRYGLNTLRWNSQLFLAAQFHCKDLTRMTEISHYGSNGSKPKDRARRFGYSSSYVGENVGAGYRTPEEAVNGWMDCPPHRQNILKADYTEISVGYIFDGRSRYGSYWTQVFGRR